MDHPSSVEPLSAPDGGPSQVIRRGDTIRRPAGAWTGTVHALLRHLERVGFTACPTVIGDGIDADGNQVLSYVEGSLVHPHAWSDESVWRVGRMLRDLHVATASFRPPADARWHPWWMHDDGPGSVITHCDAGPWNIIARDGQPVAFIDWELAGPADRLDEIAGTAWWNAQLHDDDVAQRQNLPDPPARARQLRLFLDGYELPRADRSGLVDRLIEVAIRNCAAEAVQARVTPESVDPSPLWALAWRARAASWMIRHRSLLDNAVRA
ncbi:phosphotransferase [Rugosimonospora africana]|uniref:Trifolitoxin immunity protein n=1 Tax=Rugosimonospora africana TaxID=556532 RepID=A0A8J3R4I0_9ACTN|nr:phosphotransferase [Rugosimonospora africana]GIH19896.1 trifolitoxin immunity protein [Rugosimonospora africana]